RTHGERNESKPAANATARPMLLDSGNGISCVCWGRLQSGSGTTTPMRVAEKAAVNAQRLQVICTTGAPCDGSISCVPPSTVDMSDISSCTVQSRESQNGQPFFTRVWNHSLNRSI